MRILITGGAGYIGAHAVVSAVERGHVVEVVDNLVRGRREALERAAELTRTTPVLLHEVDLCDRTGLLPVLERGFDAVIHAAAFKSVGESVRFPHLYARNNVEATHILAAAIQTVGIPAVVFSSTGCVYGGRPPFRETDPVEPLSPYASSKLDGEAALAALPDTAVTALRFFNVCGAHPSGGLGEYPGFTTNLIPILVDQLRENPPRCTVFGSDYPTPDGTCIRDYVHVMDVAEASVIAAEKLREPGYQLLNIGTGRGSSVLEVIRAVERAAGVAFEVTMGDRRSGDPTELVAEVSEVRRVLGWSASYDLDDMALSAVRWARTLADPASNGLAARA